MLKVIWYDFPLAVRRYGNFIELFQINNSHTHNGPKS